MNLTLNFTFAVNTIISLVCFYCFFRVKKAIQIQSEADRKIIDFKNFYFWYGLGYLIFILPQFFLLFQSWALVFGYILGNFFIIIGNAYFLKIPISFVFSDTRLKSFQFPDILSNWAKVVFWIVVSYGVASLAVNFTSPPHIYFNLNTHQLVKEGGKFDNFFTLGLLPVIYFGILSILYYAIKIKDRHTKIRSLILVMGLFSIFIGAPLQTLAKEFWQFVLANFLIISGYPILLSAILYKKWLKQ